MAKRQRNPFPRLRPHRGYGLICMLLDEAGGALNWDTLQSRTCESLGIESRMERVEEYNYKTKTSTWRMKRSDRGYYAGYFTSYYKKPGRYYTKDGVDHGKRVKWGEKDGHGTRGLWRLNDNGRALVAWLKQGSAEGRWPEAPEPPRLWRAENGDLFKAVAIGSAKPYVVRTSLYDGGSVWKLTWLTAKKALEFSARFEVDHGFDTLEFMGPGKNWEQRYLFNWRARDVITQSEAARGLTPA